MLDHALNEARHGGKVARSRQQGNSKQVAEAARTSMVMAFEQHSVQQAEAEDTTARSSSQYRMPTVVSYITFFFKAAL